MSADARVERFMHDNHMGIFLLTLVFVAGLTIFSSSPKAPTGQLS